MRVIVFYVIILKKQGVTYMIVCVVVDDNNGMMFNNRRQSQDKLLRKDILDSCGDNVLWFSNYSAEQFAFDFPSGFPSNIKVDDAFLSKAGEKDVCFVEELPLSLHANNIHKLIVYKWNRVYPADVYFELDLSNGNWINTSTSEFAGNSHKKITKEVWELRCLD